MKKNYIFLLIATVLTVGLGFSQTFTTIDRPNIVGPTATDNISTVSSIGFTRGTGIALSNSGNANFTSNGWTIGGDQATAEANNDYIEWSVTANTTFEIALDELDIRLRRNGNGPSEWQIFYSLDGFTSAGIALPSGSQTLASLTTTNFNLPGLGVLSGVSGTITFRLYAWGATTNGGWLRVIQNNAWDISPAVPSPGLRLVGTVTSTSTNSIESDIIVASFPGVPSTNIDYTAFNATSGLSAFPSPNSIAIGAFTIRDGGASSPDSDTDATTLNSITFDVENSENIAALAIFDGFVNVAEVTSVTDLTTFTGLNLIAPDDNTKDFFVFATFKSTVTDNEQIQLTVNSVTTPATGSSLFASGDAGAAETSIAGDDNRIEVTADQFQFVQQPTDGNQSEVMVPYPTIEAVDANLNRDLDANITGIDVTTTFGASSIVGETYDMVNGFATLDNVVFTAEEANRNLIATSTSPSLSGSSTVFDINGPLISIAGQNFDTATNWTYTTSIPPFGTVADWGDTIGYFGEIALVDAAPIDSPLFSDEIFGENDLNDVNNPFAVLTFANIDISVYNEVRIEFDWQVVGYNNNANDIQYRLFINGSASGGWVTVFDGNGSINDDQGRVKIDVPDGNTTVGLQVRLRNNRTDGYSGFDNFRIVSEFDGLVYTDIGGWKDNIEPDATTGAQDALVIDGTYSVIGNVQINDFIVNVGAQTIITVAQSLTINGDLVNNGSLELTSTSDTYSSLIVNGTSSGDVTYNRHVNQFQSIPGATTGENDLIAAPVTNSNQDFQALANANPVIPTGTINTVPSFLFGPFDNNENAYVNYNDSNLTDPVEPGIGYRTASTTPGGSLFTFVGDVETGNVSVPITVGTGSIFNLIGNPYPSYLSLSDFLDANNSLFDPGSSGVYGYPGDLTSGFTVWNQGYSDANMGAVITPGQGFLVASAAGGGTISFTPAMRSIGTSDDFILGRDAEVVPINAYLNLELSGNEKKFRTDLYFNENASLGMDAGYDAVIFNEQTPDFAIYSHLVEDNLNKDMAVQSVDYDALDNIIIPIGVNALQGEQIKFSIADTNIPEDVSIFLEDNLNNTFTDLRAGDYNITPSTALADTGRFYIHFSREQLGVADDILNGLEIFAIANPKQLVVKGQLESNTVLQVIDIQGRIMTTSQLSSNATRHSIDVSNLTSGVYIVQLQNSEATRTQKVILK
ncbi:T9SS type A sorting domain-containing protein [Winogradskyella flava]|uniref:T9SS type A sorting domain-containing protein n=1 Tax=Winogradskyella flava TaxID=1884876 RepID=A0A842IRT0_9FLAO|nr:T9SS type A sorting domain-containing protein [Winogradskyella flava]MBC2844474.1 T9SS type A sorting domain-containing protein [Winogradskyella flava]